MCVFAGRRRSSLTKLSLEELDFLRQELTSEADDCNSSSSNDSHPPRVAAHFDSDENTNVKQGREGERKKIVQHNYHDHANETAGDTINQNIRQQLKSAGRGGTKMSFPIKMHEMLDKMEHDGLASVASWQPHGRCFVVHRPKQFSEHILPTYFKLTKFASFQRQLNLYGFSRITAGKDKGGYYHEMFLRGKVFLCNRIVRKQIKGTGVRMASNPDTEPNFYAMPPVLPHGHQHRAKPPAMPKIVSSPMAGHSFIPCVLNNYSCTLKAKSNKDVGHSKGQESLYFKPSVVVSAAPPSTKDNIPVPNFPRSSSKDVVQNSRVVSEDEDGEEDRCALHQENVDTFLARFNMPDIEKEEMLEDDTSFGFLLEQMIS